MTEEMKEAMEESKALRERVLKILEKYRKPLTKEQIEAEKRQYEADLEAPHPEGTVVYRDPDPEITEMLRGNKRPKKPLCDYKILD